MVFIILSVFVFIILLAALVSAFRASAGDPPAIERPVVTHSAPEAQANEKRATGARYASTAPAPATARLRAVVEAAHVVVEVCRDAGLAVPRFGECHGLAAGSNRRSAGAPSRRLANRDADGA